MGNYGLCCKDTTGPTPTNNAPQGYPMGVQPPPIPYSPMRYSDVNNAAQPPSAYNSYVALSRPSEFPIQPSQPQITSILQQAQSANSDIPHPSYAAPAAELPQLSPSTQLALQQIRRAENSTIKMYSGVSLPPYLILHKNAVYEGEWQQGRPHGRGKLYYKNGAYFEGQFNHGIGDCSDGVFVYPDGSYYFGGVRNSAANGVGTLVYRNKEMVYKGEWLNSQPHGRGTEIFRDGSVFEGLFIQGAKEGEGTFRWANGTTYTGNFHRGDIQGNGVQTMPNGDRYEGAFIKSRRWGQGTLTTKDGRYTGEFANDKKEGQGQYECFGTKRIYRGRFQEGVAQGAGCLTLENGQSIQGTWQHGENVKVNNITNIN